MYIVHMHYIIRYTYMHMYKCVHVVWYRRCSPATQGNNKDIQQLFSAIDHRIEALKLNAQHSSDSSDQQNEAQSRLSHESSPSDEEDKESVQEDAPSSPDSTVETHTANIRQKAVSLPSDNSGCEDGGEREGDGEGQAEGEEEREGSVGSSQQSGDSEQSSTACAAK